MSVTIIKCNSFDFIIKKAFFKLGLFRFLIQLWWYWIFFYTMNAIGIFLCLLLLHFNFFVIDFYSIPPPELSHIFSGPPRWILIKVSSPPSPTKLWKWNSHYLSMVLYDQMWIRSHLSITKNQVKHGLIYPHIHISHRNDQVKTKIDNKCFSPWQGSSMTSWPSGLDHTVGLAQISCASPNVGKSRGPGKNKIAFIILYNLTNFAHYNKYGKCLSLLINQKTSLNY